MGAVTSSSDLAIRENRAANTKIIKNQKKACYSAITQTIHRIFWTTAGCMTTYNLLDAGLSHALVLESLTHGTGPLGFVGINLNGANPGYGGSSIGSSMGSGGERYLSETKNYFYVFKDSEFDPNFLQQGVVPLIRNIFAQVILKGFPSILDTFGRAFLNRRHAILSGMATMGYSLSASRSQTNEIAGYVGSVLGLFTPTLKFKFKPEEVINCTPPMCQFEDDEDYAGAAYKTTQPISVTRIGITGSLLHGIDSDTLERMEQNPEKALTGIMLLASAALVAFHTTRYIKANFRKEVTPQEAKPKPCLHKLKIFALTIYWRVLVITMLILQARY